MVAETQIPVTKEPTRGADGKLRPNYSMRARSRESDRIGEYQSGINDERYAGCGERNVYLVGEPNSTLVNLVDSHGNTHTSEVGIVR